MLPKELAQLLGDYQNAKSPADLQIKEKLEKIADCYTECPADQMAFTNVITVLFCRTLELLKKQAADAEVIANIPWDPQQPPRNNFVAYNEPAFSEQCPFSDGDSLRVAFYNHFRNGKKKSGGERVEHPEISSLDDLKKSSVNLTMRDYVARIQTFANGYLLDLPRVAELWHRENEQARVDSVLFTYNHLELILASFETKEYDQNGEKVLNKQKNNIRSALRKLNEFKIAQSARR